VLIPKNSKTSKDDETTDDDLQRITSLLSGVLPFGKNLMKADDDENESIDGLIKCVCE
jgi:hypothetical protein